MKPVLFSLVVLLLIVMWIPNVMAQDETTEKNNREWWVGGQWQRPKPNPQTKLLPLIQVKGNKFVNSKGDTILFRGLSIADPDKVELQGHWNKIHFEKVKEMGAMLVRIPIHPVAWRNRTPEEYFKLLDQAVTWCTELEMYIILDWHSIGNLHMELFQDPMYNTTKKETYEFWRAIAGHFRGHNTVAFYEIFNEPSKYRGTLGNMSWSEWKKINEDIIDLIRAYDKETIPLVAGFDWAYDLTPLHYDPIDGQNIGYVTHPYSFKRSQPWEPKWEENFGFAANSFPVIATEFGFTIDEGVEIKADDYGSRIIKYLENKGISWVCWVYDPEWHPQMLKSWDTYELTGSGKFFKEALHGKILK
jgi:endoglucanase